MAQREFEITINPDGEVEIHIKGYKGKAGCRNIASLFEKVVGPLKSLQDTSEAFEPERDVRDHLDQRH
jgi:Protein of unknown function (DUF2997)